jgi:hypothetical protein
MEKKVENLSTRTVILNFSSQLHIPRGLKSTARNIAFNDRVLFCPQVFHFLSKQDNQERFHLYLTYIGETKSVKSAESNLVSYLKSKRLQENMSVRERVTFPAPSTSRPYLPRRHSSWNEFKQPQKLTRRKYDLKAIAKQVSGLFHTGWQIYSIFTKPYVQVPLMAMMWWKDQSQGRLRCFHLTKPPVFVKFNPDMKLNTFNQTLKRKCSVNRFVDVKAVLLWENEQFFRQRSKGRFRHLGEEDKLKDIITEQNRSFVVFELFTAEDVDDYLLLVEDPSKFNSY